MLGSHVNNVKINMLGHNVANAPGSYGLYVHEMGGISAATFSEISIQGTQVAPCSENIGVGNGLCGASVFLGGTNRGNPMAIFRDFIVENMEGPAFEIYRNGGILKLEGAYRTGSGEKPAAKNWYCSASASRWRFRYFDI